MKTLFSLPILAMIWALYWVVFWFAKISKIPALRGAQYVATYPLSSWAYRVFYNGKPERYQRY